MAETGISKNCAPSTGTSSGPASSAVSLDAVFGAGVGGSPATSPATAGASSAGGAISTGAVGISAPRPRPRPPMRGRLLIRFILAANLGANVAATFRACAAPRDLMRGLKVSDGSARARVVGHDGLTETGRLGDPHVARDRRGEHKVGEVVAHLGRDLVGEAGAAVVHREEHGADGQRGVQVRAHQL